MAPERHPYDPARPTEDDLLRRRTNEFDEPYQADPELAEGRAGSGRIALFAIAVVAILAVVFYGLNSSNVSPESTPTAQTAPTSPPPGQTTGSSTTAPSQSPMTRNPSAPQNDAAPPAPGK